MINVYIESIPMDTASSFEQSNTDCTQSEYSITFVSAFFSLRKTPFYTKSHPELWNPEPLMDIISLGVPFCLYIGKECIYESMFREWELQYPNFRIMSYRVDYTDTWIHKQCIEMLERGIPIALPDKRNKEKDTYEYLVYMNSRAELVEDAISENVWNTTHYAWVDFQLTHLFKQKRHTLEQIRKLSLSKLASSTIAFPGCWAKLENVNTIATDIHWRFCGSFFVGDAEKVQEFSEQYRKHFPLFLEKYRCLPWEVNFWAYLEHIGEWTPTWYRGDHNDSIVSISADLYATSLFAKKRDTESYNYPELPGYYPGSASYLYHQGRHLLNTRYVSYWMYPNGYYRFRNNDFLIENRNVFSELDERLIPKSYNEMGTLFDKNGSELISIQHKKRISEGLEDIRLYSLGDSVRFIATTYGYSPIERSRMMVGTYDLDALVFRECELIMPPTDTMCEKNWVPLPKYNEQTSEWEEWFVYKWSPFELGKVQNGTLCIEKRFETNPGIFSKIRGSTTFSDYGDGKHLVGLVHFSEEHTPRHYYHMLVLLDKETFEPKQCSETFYFESLSIEFCIGMNVSINGENATTYTFWISRFDRDPLKVTVPANALPIRYL